MYMGYYAKNGAYVHDEHDTPYRPKYGEPLRGVSKAPEGPAKGTFINMQELREEQARYEANMQRLHAEADELTDMKQTAIKHIVEEKRAAYNNKSWLNKAFDKLRGKKFDEFKVKREVSDDVYNWSESRLEGYVDRIERENNTGRSR